ncbi:MAG: hypothetical protein K6G52_09240 [Treponemataceae bacterium]|nr:hypothetical protein [Treponemataceae bacterium]
MKKHFFYQKTIFLVPLFVWLFVSSAIFAQSYSSNVEIRSLPSQPEWYCVLPGSPICPLERTSYGIATVTDQRCLVLVDCYKKSIYRQRNLDYSFKYLTVGFSDFLFVVDGENKLHVYNPTAVELFEKALSISPVQPPVVGTDGSLFFRDASSILVCDMMGNQKRLINLDDQNTSLPLIALEDGSLIAVQNYESENMTKIVRFSTNLDIIQEIKYDTLISRMSYFKGILFMKLRNGTIEQLKLDKNVMIKTKAPSKMLSAVISAGFDSSYIQGNGNPYLCFSESSILTIEKNNSIQSHYEYGFSEFVKVSYCNSYLLVAFQNWTLNAYKIKIPISEQKVKNSIRKVDYSTFAANFSGGKKTIETLLSEAKTSPEKCATDPLNLKLIDEYAWQLHREYNQNYTLENRDLLIKTGEDARHLLEVITLLNLKQYSFLYCDVINCDSNSLNVAQAIQFASVFAYDEGLIMKSIERYVHDSKKMADPLLCSSICNFVYENCRVMGLPVIINQGKKLMTYMLSVQTNQNVRTSARATIEKIIALEM